MRIKRLSKLNVLAMVLILVVTGTTLHTPVWGTTFDVHTAKMSLDHLAKFRRDAEALRSLADTTMTVPSLSGSCTRCTKKFIFCLEERTTQWSIQADFTSFRKRLDRALENASQHASTFNTTYRPMQDWLHDLPRFSADFDSAESVVQEVREDIRLGTPVSDEQKRRVTETLRKVETDLEHTSRSLTEGTRALTNFLHRQSADRETIRAAEKALDQSGQKAFASIAKFNKDQMCGESAAKAQLHQLKAVYLTKLSEITESLQILETSSHNAERGLGDLLQAVISTQTQVSKIRQLIEAASKDQLGSFLEQVHLSSAAAQWRDLAGHLLDRSASNPFPMPQVKPRGQPWCGDFENGVDWPAPGHKTAIPRGYMPSTYQPRDGVQGALFADPYQWGGERCGGWCVTRNGHPSCVLRAQ